MGQRVDLIAVQDSELLGGKHWAGSLVDPLKDWRFQSLYFSVMPPTNYMGSTHLGGPTLPHGTQGTGEIMQTRSSCCLLYEE